MAIAHSSHMAVLETLHLVRMHWSAIPSILDHDRADHCLAISALAPPDAVLARPLSLASYPVATGRPLPGHQRPRALRVTDKVNAGPDAVLARPILVGELPRSSGQDHCLAISAFARARVRKRSGGSFGLDASCTVHRLIDLCPSYLPGLPCEVAA
jgi:hypothetical protein